jgi:tetratricopeptide (TPR) repeat protein
VPDRLRALWDFDDLDATESRLRAQLAAESSKAGRAEVLTQLARVAGLRGDFGEGERLVEEAEPLAAAGELARARVDLERGRLRRSSGNRTAAFPLFVSAFALADEAGELSVAADAAHMAALAAPDESGFLDWTERGIELVEDAEPADRYWLGPLLNNLGWHHFEAGAYGRALAAFERALAERERDPGDRSGNELALYAVAKTLRALGRPQEGAPLLERAVASAAEAGRSDGWLEEELAETYAAFGRTREAREHATHALALLPDQDPDFDLDGERGSRLRELAPESGAV